MGTYMSLCGDNFVKLVGVVTKKQVTAYGDSTLFKCILSIPTPGNQGDQKIGVSTWGEKALYLNDIQEGTWLRIFGHIEKTSYKTKCRYCSGATTSYWTDVVIDNFVVLGEEDE